MSAPRRLWPTVRLPKAPYRRTRKESPSDSEQRLNLEGLLEKVASAVGDVPALLAVAQQIGRSAPAPGQGRTAELWELLASVASVDVAAARILEPHLDAGAILAQAGASSTFAGTWGVYAAEAAGARLTAGPPSALDGASTGNSGQPAEVELNGSKPWCSLAQFLDRAVVTAHTGAGARAAFTVDLRAAGVTCEVPEWTSRGLQEIPSGTVHFDRVPALPLGGDDWYFQRPGFAWGGMGVAACWLGGAVALGRHFEAALQRGTRAQRQPDQVALASLGEVDRILTSTLQYLARVADATDGAAEGDGACVGAWSEALRVRGTVAAAVERVQQLVSQNLGPGPLAFDERYGKCMADLSLYVRQHHAARDDAQLGTLTLKGERAW